MILILHHGKDNCKRKTKLVLRIMLGNEYDLTKVPNRKELMKMTVSQI